MRLFHRIYVSLLLVAFAGIAGAILANHDLLKPQMLAPFAERLEAEGHIIERQLVAADRHGGGLQPALADAAAALGLMALLVDAEGRTLATSGDDLTVKHALPTDRRWVDTRSGLARIVSLTGGRQLLLRPRHQSADVSYVAAGAVLFLLMALLCHPVARSLASRLERLEAGVRGLGRGTDRHACRAAGPRRGGTVAASFNEAADRVEALLAAQKRVLASASHELRSPLTRLRMGLELIRDRTGSAVEAQLDAAAREIEDLDGLVEDVLLASRLEAGRAERAEPVDLETLLRSEAARVGATVADATGAGPSAVDMRLPADSRLVTITGEPRSLRRLIRNLLDNASRFSAGAPVCAGVEPLAGGGVRIVVADRGPGIPADLAERVFEPFYRVPGQQAAGSGLGLALVRQIAASHAGRACCRPRAGGGTEFEVVLRGR